MPLADEGNEEVAFELAVKHLTEEVQVGNEGGLQNDGDVRGVEQLNWEGSGVATNSLALQSEVHLETLEIDHNKHYDNGSC